MKSQIKEKNMISSQIIQKTLDELRTITRIDLCVMDVDGKVNSSTFPVENEDFGDVRAFADSMADSQVMKGYHFFKIYDNQSVEYVLIAKGGSEDATILMARVQKLGGRAAHFYYGANHKGNHRSDFDPDDVKSMPVGFTVQTLALRELNGVR